MPPESPSTMLDVSDDAIESHLRTFSDNLERNPSFRFLAELAIEFPGSEVFVVGGVIRDIMLQRDAKDVDCIVRGIPADALEAFLASRGRVNLVGRTFGVFKFIPHGHDQNDEAIDIALPRTEHAEGTGGYRDVDVQSDPNLAIEDDLARRDFTINAMAWNVGKRQLVDPFNGRSDLSSKMIRAVGEPEERFGEDRSRMLRALRFACQLGFSIETNTMTAIQAGMDHINEERPAQKVHEQTTLISKSEFVTPREVIARECIKSFVADPVRAMDLWDEAGAFDQLMPELLAMKGCAQPEAYHSEGDVWTHTRMALSLLSSEAYRTEFSDAPPSALVVLGVLLHDIGKPPTQKTPERDGADRIRFDGHDKIGGDMVRAIARRLTLSAPFPKGHHLHVHAEDLGLIVDHHLLLLQDPTTMRSATIEKYFFNPNKPGEALQRVSFCDGSAAIPANSSEPDMAHFRALRKRLKEIAAIVAERERLPKPILNGHQIMKHFTLAPGAHMKALIEIMREEQLRVLTEERRDLTEEEAYAFLAPHVGTIVP